MENLKIEKSIFRDYDLSSIYFNETFKILRYSGYREFSILLYTDYGNLSNDFYLDNSVVIEGSQENINNFKRELIKNYYGSDLRNTTIKELFEYFLEYYGFSDFSHYEEMIHTLDKLNVSYEKNYYLTSSRGYSQGDYSEILINIKEFKEVIGNDFNIDDYQQHFNNLLWDSPLSFNIDISFDLEFKHFEDKFYKSFEINLNDFGNENYNIDKLLDLDNIKAYIKKETFNNISDKDLDIIIKDLDNISYEDIKD